MKIKTQKYTTEPWEVAFPKDTIRNRLEDPDGHLDVGIGCEVEGKKVVIAETFGRVGESIYIDSEANARRIVACINACEGINPEAVKDLLAALKHALPGLIGESERIARAAIAKSERVT